MNYDIMENLRNLMLNKLIKLELSTNEGIILDKQLHPNEYLQQLTISLQTLNDLFILFDGLLPNLIVLNVNICQSNTYKRTSISRCWSRRFMSHLVEFQLKTNANVEMTFDQIRRIVMPLIQLEKLMIDVSKWFSYDQQFVQGNQIEMLINEFMPRLRHFHCSIKTIYSIEMQ
ncbi:unnamed protein product, partial [Rotaria sp. Silwood2]